jgi:hypothetical protein
MTQERHAAMTPGRLAKRRKARRIRRMPTQVSLLDWLTNLPSRRPRADLEVSMS